MSPWVLIGTGGTALSLWAGIVYAGYKAWENPAIRTGIKLAAGTMIPG